MNLTFENALQALKIGRPVERSGWEGQCWLIMNHGLLIRGRREWHPEFAPTGKLIGLNIQLCSQASPHAVVWKPTQDDLLAEDWIIR